MKSVFYLGGRDGWCFSSQGLHSLVDNFLGAGVKSRWGYSHSVHLFSHTPIHRHTLHSLSPSLSLTPPQPFTITCPSYSLTHPSPHKHLFFSYCLTSLIIPDLLPSVNLFLHPYCKHKGGHIVSHFIGKLWGAGGDKVGLVRAKERCLSRRVKVLIERPWGPHLACES